METNEIDTINDADKENIGKTITLQVLGFIKQNQLEHGLKHGDYQRYRIYCANRLKRIRKSLSFFRNTGPKNRTVYQAKLLTPAIVFDEKNSLSETLKYLCIPLICAERGWAYAMGSKQEISTNPRRKFHMIRRLRKSVFWSSKLRDFSNDEKSICDPRTKLETCAYADYLQGLYHFELDHWQKASDLLTNAQNIYEQLYKLLKDEDLMTLYKQRLDEIKSTIRYCAFNIGEQKIEAHELIKEIKNDSTLSNKINQLISQTAATQSDSFEIEWLGKTMFIKHDKILRFIDQLKDPGVEWQLNFYEQMIFDCRDCLQLLRDTNAEKSSLYTYLTYIRLDLIIKRNLVLINTLKNPSDLLRQYEAIIGCYNEIKSLNLNQSFPDSYLIEKFLTEIDAHIIVYKAFRCYYISHVAKDNWKESIALLDRASFYCQQSLKNEFVSKEEIRNLLNKTNAEKFQIYGENISKDHTDLQNVKQLDSEKILINNLDTFFNDPDLISGKTNLINLPLEYRAIPAKPLFFDLALNHIKFPSLDEEINANKPQQSDQTAGLTGIVKGWLGGWKK
ncbi:Signal recognition particle subunit SRP68 [Sarcoptes scabiei]|nr:Signal recognition particle subunit SRP68 [Sarcoptes scabiei]